MVSRQETQDHRSVQFSMSLICSLVALLDECLLVQADQNRGAVDVSARAGATSLHAARCRCHTATAQALFGTCVRGSDDSLAVNPPVPEFEEIVAWDQNSSDPSGWGH